MERECKLDEQRSLALNVPIYLLSTTGYPRIARFQSAHSNFNMFFSYKEIARIPRFGMVFIMKKYFFSDWATTFFHLWHLQILIPQYQVLLIKLSRIYTVSLKHGILDFPKSVLSRDPLYLTNKWWFILVDCVIRFARLLPEIKCW